MQKEKQEKKMTEDDIKEENMKFDSYCMRRNSCNGCQCELKCFPNLSPKKEVKDVFKEIKIPQYKSGIRWT